MTAVRIPRPTLSTGAPRHYLPGLISRQVQAAANVGRLEHGLSEFGTRAPPAEAAFRVSMCGELSREADFVKEGETVFGLHPAGLLEFPPQAPYSQGCCGIICQFGWEVGYEFQVSCGCGRGFACDSF